MADNVAITAGAGTTIATDDVSGVHFQRVKLVNGTLESNDAIPGDANGLLVRATKANQVVNGTIVIANGGTVTATGGDANDGIIDLRLKALVGIQMPAAWTAANLTFSASMDGGSTYADLYDDSSIERLLTVTTSRSYAIDPAKFLGCTHLKIRSGTSAAPVSQGGARTIIYTTIAL